MDFPPLKGKTTSVIQNYRCQNLMRKFYQIYVLIVVTQSERSQVISYIKEYRKNYKVPCL